MFCCKALSAQPIEVIGLCDPKTIEFAPSGVEDRNWTEISVAELLQIPPSKPDIETIDKVFISVKIISKRFIDTPDSEGRENAEGTLLTGKKLIIEGIVFKKIVYTAKTSVQSVHSAQFEIPFSAYIVMKNDLEEPFCLDVCIEDVFIKAFGPRQIFNNDTIFLRAY